MTDQHQPSNEAEAETETKKLGPIAVIGSVMSAAFGVQSSKNRERDFTQGKFRNYVIAAIGFVIVFIFCVFSLVQFVLSKAG